MRCHLEGGVIRQSILRSHRSTGRPVTPQQPQVNPQSSPIAGSVLPLQKAEELIASLQDVVSARITATETGSVDTIHVLVSGGVPAKAVVRNIESALMAQLGLRVDHRKISVASTAMAAPRHSPLETPMIEERPSVPSRTVYFEDVEVRGSRARGVTCKVTLRIGGEHFAGEAEEGMQSDRSRVDVAARATLTALALSGPTGALFSLEGVKVMSAFDREFVFAAVMARSGREQLMLTGSCEVRESAETAAVLAVLDATNRWMMTLTTGAPVMVADRRSSGR